MTAAPDETFLGAAEAAAAYRPATGTWRKLAAPPQTESYCRRSAAWTGEELLVWGCAQTGLDPRTDRWRRLPPAPTGPPGLVAWTGRELIGWGGGCCGDASAGGAAYDPASNAWRKLARSPLAPSQGPVGAWTGRELILFVSGHDPDGRPAGGARAAAYDPATDAWRVIAPPPALRAAAVWDGDEILLAGGLDEHGAPATDGYAYDPATNRWRVLPALPSGRAQASAVWTGTQLLLVGDKAEPVLAYDPRLNRWSSLPHPLRARSAPAAVWTGRELLLWDGSIGAGAGAALDTTSQFAGRGGQ